jgi:tRNA (guanine10-N2)-methyltransferase
VPPTKPYELSALATDLVVLARYLLKPGGRLVFFLPTVIDEYKELDLDSMLCDGMQVVANSLQDFGAWGRRVRRHLFISSLFLPRATSLKLDYSFGSFVHHAVKRS